MAGTTVSLDEFLEAPVWHAVPRLDAAGVGFDYFTFVAGTGRVAGEPVWVELVDEVDTPAGKRWRYVAAALTPAQQQAAAEALDRFRARVKDQHGLAPGLRGAREALHQRLAALDAGSRPVVGWFEVDWGAEAPEGVTR